VVEFSEEPWQLAAAVDRLLVPPPHIDVSSVRRPLVPVERFLDHFRTILRTRRGFQFEEAVKGLDRHGVEHTITGTELPFAWSCSRTCHPSIPGNNTSSSTASGAQTSSAVARS